MNWKKTALLCSLILLTGVAVTAVIFFTEPTARREGATKEGAILVDVTLARRGTFRPTIVAMGIVQPAREIILSPRVGGEVINLAAAFAPGEHVAKGALLLRIDPSDYQNTLQQRKSELRQAIADLNLETGRQNVARKDYQLLGEELSAENEALMLRKPQLNTARARVEAARSTVSQAELDLRRTSVTAPFAAHILSREVNVGSQVSAGDRLGRLVGVETYWVETTVPVAKLRWIDFPGSAGEDGADVRIYNRGVWPAGSYRHGRVLSLIGALEEQTRLARVLVDVPDPLALQEDSDKPVLIIGTFVEVHIEADEIEGAVRLDRDHLRQGNTVWVMRDGKLDIRKVEVAFQDAEYAYIESGLEDGDEVVTSTLSTVTEGVRLRLETEATGSGQSSADASPPRQERQPGGGG